MAYVSDLGRIYLKGNKSGSTIALAGYDTNFLLVESFKNFDFREFLE